MSVLSPSSARPSAVLGAFEAYRDLPSLSGWSYLPISFLARLPLTMAPIAILALTAATTGSLATAGVAAASMAAGSAVGAPVVGALADRRGQRPVLLAIVGLNGLAMTALALAPALPHAAVFVLCALIGLTVPQVGGMSRARWFALNPHATDTAMAYEGTVDETAYVLGPALVGVLGTLAGPRVPVLTAALLVLLAVGAFAVHPTHSAPSRRAAAIPAPRREDAPSRSAALRRAVMLPALALVLVGMFFAAVQSGITAFAATTSAPSSGGLLYALMAVGSSVTALATAVVPATVSVRTRCALSASVLVVGVAGMAFGTSLLTLGAAVLFSGLGVGPLLVTLNSVAGHRAPAGSTATAMAFLSSGSVTGIALGAVVAGPLAQTHGPIGAFAVAGAAAAAVVVMSLVAIPVRSRKGSDGRRTSPPETS